MRNRQIRQLTLITTLVIVLVTMLLVTNSIELIQAAPEQTEVEPVQPVVASTDPWVEHAPDRVIIKIKPGVTLNEASARTAGADSALGELLQQVGATDAKPLFATTPAAQARSAASSQRGLERIYQVDYTSPISVEHVAALLAAHPDVEYAEPDYIARQALVPNDPDYGQQWALPKINAPAAWDVTTGNGSVVIAIIDSGVQQNHPDFAGRLWTNSGEVAGNGVDDDLNGFVDDVNGWNFVGKNNNVADSNGHGTQVAGVAGAATNNGIGVAGLCWNCKLMFVNVMQPSGIANYSDIAAAVQYAASNGAQIINLSLGGYADSALLRDAIREAAVSAVIVGGAGNNDSATPFYPAAYPEVIAVASTDVDDKKAVFSNYGAWVDVAAPGKSIRTTTVGGYVTADGTSLSAPFVAGLAGLIRSANPTWSPELVRWQILNTAVSIDSVNPSLVGQLGRGRISAGAALATQPQASASVTGYSLDGQASARPAPGQTVQLVVTLHNQWMPARNLQASLISSDPYVTITDASGSFGSIEPGKSGSNSSDPFGVTVAANAPYNHPLALTLNLSGDDYSYSVPITIPVQVALQNVSGIISINTQWTNDKTYIVRGHILVSQGVTLSIESGTVISYTSGGHFIQVDGTLIAEGTAAAPIIFKQGGAGIRFTESSSDYDKTLLTGSRIVYAIFEGVGFHEIGNDTRCSQTYHASAININGSSPLISSNKIYPSGYRNPHCVQGIIAYDTSSEISHNLIDGADWAGIYTSGNPLVTNNIVQRSGYSQNCVVAMNGGVFRSNVLRGNLSGELVLCPTDTIVEGNLFHDNGNTVIRLGPNSVIRHNNFLRYGVGIFIGGYMTSTLTNNNFLGGFNGGSEWGGGCQYNNYNILVTNGGCGVYGGGGEYQTEPYTITVRNNYWNSTNPDQISEWIRDRHDDFTVFGTADFSDFLQEPDYTAPAFIRNVDMNTDVIGLEQGAVTIDFSRPMDTSIMPAASFHDHRRGTTEQMYSGTVRILTKDVIGRLWIAVEGNGLRMYDGRTWTSYTTANSGLGSDNIIAAFSSANGDVWFAHGYEQVSLSRLQGSSWITYPHIIAGGMTVIIFALGEDTQGRIWAVTSEGIFYFDGSLWHQAETSETFSADSRSSIVRDGQGHMWFHNYSNLIVYDGLNWRSYEQPENVPITSIFADSHGRVWIGLGGWHTNDYKNLAMYDGLNWFYYGSQEANGLLNCSVDGIGEASDGALWFSSCGSFVAYAQGMWVKPVELNGALSNPYEFIFDDHGNHWYNIEPGFGTGLQVRWSGLDHDFSGGEWLSPTRFQASFDFTPLIPRGHYQIQVDGAVGEDGIAAYGGSVGTFEVAYSGAITTLPPLPPSAQAETNGTVGHLQAVWQAKNDNVDSYRYAIGTFPGGRDLVGWTYLAGTSVVRNDLQLRSGQTYYVTVQARNTSGLWSADGVSNAVVAGKVTNPTPTPSPTPTPIIPLDDSKIYLPFVNR